MANEHSQIVPSMQPTAKVADFKFWCQKVLPLVYDDSLSYYEVLNKMVVYLNQVIDNINADIDNVAELEDDFLLLQTYVNNFFDDIDQLVTYTERAEAAQTAAATSAINAASSASNAATSASNSADSASSAATSALSAMDAKDAAIAAKTAAEAALASAQTAATNAANSATAASNSATAASGSATAASGSATNAAASATTAQQSFTLADAARAAAQTAATNAANSADAAAASAASADGAKAQAMIATEDTTTATNAHSVGEFFRMSGNLYVATADIQIGDTITVGTNCRAAVVGEELSEINADVTKINNQLGTTETVETTFQITRVSMNSADTKTPLTVKTGDVLTVLFNHGDSNLNSVAVYLYDSTNTLRASIGNAIHDIPFQYTAVYDAIAFGIYFTNATFPSTVELDITITREGGLITAVTSMIAKVLNTPIADTALSVNDFRIVNNILYKITAPIASGGTLTPGTNCVATTVSEILKTLLT